MVLSFAAPAHSVTALRYRLYTGAVDLAPLVVRQEKTFAWQSCRVTAYVLGASHALTVALPDGREFTELLTCLPPRVQQAAPAPGFADEWLLPDANHAPVTRKLCGLPWVSGSVQLSRFPLAPGMDKISNEFAMENTLHEPFSALVGPPAWTRIAWRIDGPTLQVETVHTYPNDGAGIRSKTNLRLLPEGSK